MALFVIARALFRSCRLSNHRLLAVSVALLIAGCIRLGIASVAGVLLGPLWGARQCGARLRRRDPNGPLERYSYG